MRRSWVLLVGAAMLSLAACKPADSADGTATAPAHACVSTFEGRTATCMRFSNIAGGPEGMDRLRKGCLVVPGQTWSATCPADSLAGCCTMKQPDGTSAETCFYKDGALMGTPAQCAKDGGAWSAAP